MSNQSGYLLLKNGTVLIHGENDSVKATETDVLVSGSKIAKLAPNIDPPQGSQVMYETILPIQHFVLTIAIRFIQRLHRKDHLSRIRRYASPRMAEPTQRAPCEPNVDAIHARRQFHFKHALARRHLLGSTRGLHGDDRLRYNISGRLQPYQLLLRT
jgi:hypothetical protein